MGTLLWVGAIAFLTTGVGVAIGMVANWIPAPLGISARRAGSILAVLVIVATFLAVVVWYLNPGNGPSAGLGAVRDPASPDISRPTPTAETASTRRSLHSWISDVNEVCGPVIPKVNDEKKRYESSKDIEVGVSSLENARELLEPVIKDINTAIELPSDPTEKSKASDWISSYNAFYEKFIDTNHKLRTYLDSNVIEQFSQSGELQAARDEFFGAVTKAKSVGDRLGIKCPWVNT